MAMPIDKGWTEPTDPRKFLLDSRQPARLACTLLVLLLLSWSWPQRAAAQADLPQVSPPAIGSYRIAGTVVNAKGGGPLARATVQIQNAKNRQSTRTVIASDDGHFEFRVTAGKFGLQAAKHGFITSFYNAHEQFSTAIVTGAGLDTEHLVLRLPPDAVLSGQVLDESGEPVRDAAVNIYRENRSTGITRTLLVESTATDDQGNYEAASLAEGTYFVAVRAVPWYAVHPVTGQAPVDHSLDVAYPITYYGDATQSDEATPIPVRGGDHLEADIRLAPVPAVHLTVRADEQHVEPPNLQVSVFDGLDQVQGSGMERVSPGVYEVSGLAPGRYVVRMPNPSGELKAPAEMDLTSGEELDSSSAREVSEIKAAAHMRGAAHLPEDLQLALRTNQGKLMAWERVNEKGVAQFSDIAPGRYDVLASTNDRAYAVVHLSSSEGDAAGKSLDVPAGASLEIAVTVVGGVATVEGVAKRAGKPVPGAMIVLVPKDPEGNRELFRRDESDLDGTFALQNVVPGSYTLLAIEDGWDLDWATPAVLAAYLPHGQRVIVDDKARGVVHVSTALEVQKSSVEVPKSNVEVPKK